MVYMYLISGFIGGETCFRLITYRKLKCVVPGNIHTNLEGFLGSNPSLTHPEILV